MPRHPQLAPAGTRLADKILMAQTQRYFPMPAVREALAKSNKETKRVRELPNELVAYFPMMLCMYRQASQKEVLRLMADGLTWTEGLREFKVTGKSGISQARARVGSEPLIEVFEKCARPLATPSSIGSFVGGLRLVALDGAEVDVDDCPENAEYFGRPKNQHGNAAYPKAKLVGLVEIGTRTAFALNVGKYKDSENQLCLDVIKKLRPGMLCLADQLYMSFEIFEAAQKTGAELLFRARTDRVLPREEILPDGSYLTTIYHNADRKREKGIAVRVVDFDLEVTGDGKKAFHRYILLTTLLDHKQFSFDQLAELYHERWEIETMLGEVKTQLMDAEPLRSRAPDLVIQEIYGMFMAHYVIRAVMYDAAAQAKIDPDELSFAHARNVVERNLPKLGVFPPSGDLQTHAEGSVV